jgi:mono/diheme cytochrome c family protein
MTSRTGVRLPKHAHGHCAGLILTLGIAALLLVSTAGPATADGIRGGRLYDKYWADNGAPVPTGDHPLYPAVGQQSGSSTYRCKECHGWDYKGVDGAYGPGSSHFTGIPGVIGSMLSPAEMFDLIKSPDGDGTGGTVPNGHDYGIYGLSDADIDDVVEYLQTLLIDTDAYIDMDGVFFGDEAQGQMNYEVTGMCTDCHGPDGTWINFGTPEDPEYVGTIAVDNPWELMHKVRVGQPGAPMPSWIQNGGSNQGVADIGVYAQLNFPTGGDGGDGGDGGTGVPATADGLLLALTLALMALGARAVMRSR